MVMKSRALHLDAFLRERAFNIIFDLPNCGMTAKIDTEGWGGMVRIQKNIQGGREAEVYLGQTSIVRYKIHKKKQHQKKNTKKTNFPKSR
jgi:hypothetical protein